MTRSPESPHDAKKATGIPERIPFVDLRAQYHAIRDEARAAFDQIAESAAYSNGPAVAQFEQEFAAACGVSECVGVNTGTSALHLALRCLDIGPGDEVITVPMTFIATVWAICYTGARPVFIDIDPVRRTMDPALLEAAITPRTKAIIPVHLHGQMSDMQPILAIAKKHGIAVVEDACQAHGATDHGRKAGSVGLMGCFSFYPSKNLGAFGEGGALVTHDSRLAGRARQLRNHAQHERHLHGELGYNYRMDSLQAAMLSLKLKHLDRWNLARSDHAGRFAELLAGLPITLPANFADSPSVFHCYVIESDRRDELCAALDAAQIDSGLHYPVPLHLQQACRDLGHIHGDFPHSEAFARRCLSLPIFPELTDAQMQRIATALRAELT
ncbi:MAG: DegT/DnrJ/EryC1/StrS family aminotransferase [Verrucomicrobiaceae bacterium]